MPIEDAVKEAVPLISNAMLIGDKKKFLSMLITIKVKTRRVVESRVETSPILESSSTSSTGGEQTVFLSLHCHLVVNV